MIVPENLFAPLASVLRDDFVDIGLSIGKMGVWSEFGCLVVPFVNVFFVI